MKRATLETVLDAQKRRKPIAVITELESGSQRVVPRENLSGDPLAAVLAEGFRFDRSGICREGGTEQFITIHNPPLRLVIIGAVHIAQSVIPMAQLAGYDVTVIDPRGAFATGARFPGIALHAEWPDEVIPQVGLDARTALIALTHDPKIDDPALHAALNSEVFYIGALGSKKTHGSRLDRLRKAGFSDDALARIHGPIGLAIGAQGAAEIAISIVGEMTRALRLGQ